MHKNFYRNSFYSWYTLAAFINLLIAGLGAKDIRLLTLAVLMLTVFVVMDIKSYIAKQLAEHQSSTERRDG